MTPRTLNVETMTVNQLATVVFNSSCPIARLVAIEELRRRTT